MNPNTVLSKSIDNKTTKNHLQSLQAKKRAKTKAKKAAEIDIVHTELYATRNIEALGLIKIQIVVKEKKFQFIW